MMRSILTVSIMVALAAGPACASADCTAPNATAIAIPDGSTATRDQMVAAQRAVKAYDTAVKAYGDCLQQQLDAQVSAGANKQQLSVQYDKMNNDQVDKLQKLADKFNEELRAFKARNSG
jgi:predicted outer membrane protein